jgi:hypothetical protein
MRNVLSWILVAVSMVALGPSSALSCSCILSSPTDALDHATRVFSGRVTAMEDPYAGDILQDSLDPVIITFIVERVWKGDVGPTVQIQTARDGASCGFTFHEGEQYLVYAYNSQVSLCSRTKVLASASEDLAELGAGHEPARETTASSARRTDSTPAPPRPGEPGSRVGTPRYIGVGEPYVPPPIEVLLMGLPSKQVGTATVQLKDLRWAVSLWKPGTARYDDLSQQVAAPMERIGEGKIAFDVPPGRYQIRIQVYDLGAAAWRALYSYPDILGHYCINCFDHPAHEYHPIAGTFEVDFTGYPFVTVSLVSVPAAAKIEDHVVE